MERDGAVRSQRWLQMTEPTDMNAIIRRAAGREEAVPVNEGGEAAPPAHSYAGKADGGEGGERNPLADDMNVLLRRATGRPGKVDEHGRAWA